MPTQNLAKAVLLALVAYFLMSVTGVLVKNMSGTVSTEVITFWQFFVFWIAILPMVWKAGGLKSLYSDHGYLIALRAVFGIVAYFCFYYSVQHIPLIDAVLLLNSAPLYLPIVAYFWGNKKVDPKLWIGIIIGFIGIMIILRPGTSIFQVGAILGALSGILSSIILIAIRRTVQFVSPTTLLFYYALTGSIVFCPWAITDSGSYSALIWVQLLATGLIMYIMEYLITLSFKHASAVVLGPLSYVSIIFSGLLAWILWGHVPDLWTISGTILVVAGAISTILMSPTKT